MSRLLRTLSIILVLAVFVPTQTVLALTKAERENLITPFYDPNSVGFCATILPGSDNPQKIWNFLLEKELSAPQIAGIMGNLQSESAGTWDPRVVEFGYPNSQGVISKAGDPSTWDDEVPPNAKTNGQPGYGIVQWTAPGRKQGLKDLAIDRETIGGDLGTQLEYLWIELATSYKKSTLDPILATNDYIEATDIFLEKYENPAHIERTRPVRRSQALDWLNQFGSMPESTSSTGSTSTCDGGPVALDASGCPTDTVDENQTVVVEGIRVHACISAEVERIVKLANSQGLNMSGGGWRDTAKQIELRKKHCGTSNFAIYEMSPSKCSPPTARPGASLHERGTAVDFTCSGRSISSRSNPCFVFLEQNTSLKNLPSEPWHWSVSGG